MTRSRVWPIGLVVWISLLVMHPQAPAQSCVGDCDGNGQVAINELILCVRVALGQVSLGDCPSCDANGDGEVRISELITSVSHALCQCSACPTPRPTSPAVPTATSPPAVPTRTATVIASPTPAACACDFNGTWVGTEDVSRDTCDPDGLGPEPLELTIVHECGGPLTMPPGIIGTPEIDEGRCCVSFTVEEQEDDGKSCTMGQICLIEDGNSFTGGAAWQFFENPNASCTDTNFVCDGSQRLTGSR